TTLFAVEYFGETAYLTQSGQLYGEAGAMALGRIYCFGPTFRAEKSKTRRQLTEFWMVEPEMAFAGLDEDMDLAEDFPVHVVGAVRERRQPELRALGRDLAPLARVEKPFPRITYDEALDILRAKGFPLEWGADLGGDGHEDTPTRPLPARARGGEGGCVGGRAGDATPPPRPPRHRAASGAPERARRRGSRPPPPAR